MKFKFNTFCIGYGLFFLAFALFVPAYQGDFKLQLLLSVFGLSVLWAYWVQFKWSPITIVWSKPIIYSSIALFLLAIPALTIDVPWRGDEDSNIDFVRIYTIITPLYQWIFAFIAYIILGSLLLKRSSFFPKIKWLYALMGVLGFAYAIYRIDVSPYYNAFDYVFVVSRLTYLFRLLPLAFVVPASWFGALYEPFFYRLIPFLSYLAILWLIAEQWNVLKKKYNYVYIAIIALTPSLLIFHHVLYTELIGVFLLIFVLGGIDDWMHLSFTQLKNNRIWIGIILLPFVKESFILIVALLLGIRWLHQLIQKKSVFAILKWSEIKLSFILFLPLVFYLYLRNKVNLRPAALSSIALSDVQTYVYYFRSICEQFGAIMLLYIVGLYWMWRKKQQLKVVFFALAPLAIYLFFAADSDGIYKGYARFNLLLLPFFIYPTQYVIAWISEHMYVIRALCLLLGIQILLLPIHLNGTKKAYWGDYFYDTSEHYYPFYEAFTKAKAAGVTNITYLSNRYEPYFYRFNYTFKHLNYTPIFNTQSNMGVFNPNDALSMVQQAFSAGAQVVILQAHDFSMQSRGTLATDFYQVMLNTCPYSIELIDNGEHQLLYIKQ